MEMKIGEATLGITPIKFWFSHPAVRSLKAVEATKSAARTVGFRTRPIDQLHIIKAPEAAIYCSNYKLSDP